MAEGIVITVAGTVIAAAVIGILTWTYRSRHRPGRWVAGQVADAKREESLAEAHEVAVLRTQVLDVARGQGKVLPEQATGTRPTVVTFSNGEKQAYFTDFQAYQSAMRARTVDPTRTHHVRALPVPVSAWNRAQLEQWLAEHSA